MTEVDKKLVIRNATMEDLFEVAAVEAECFPVSEAAMASEFRGRIACYGGHFWLLFEDERLVSFVDGMVTDQEDLTDEMYERAELHQEAGEWQMIFGVATDPAEQGKGYAAALMRRVIADTKSQGKKGLVLTCKERLLSFYGQFGYRNEGVSGSEHGGAVWYEMRLTF